MVDFVGAARPINTHDVALAANVYKISLAALRAVMAVESRNSGFDGRRRPIILFEPHVFYRNLHGSQRDDAVAAGLAYPNWKGPGFYPKGSDAQYERLSRAIQINEEAAYRAISVGIGQVLGENYRAAGCTSAKQMFQQAMEDEAHQLRHMLEFIKFNRLDDELRRIDWHGFARGYNGKGQVDRYAAWLDREYKKWQRILAKPREELDEQDLKDAGSKTIEAAETGKAVVKGVVITGTTAGAALDAATQGLQPVTQAVQTAQSAKSAWDWVSENWQFLAAISLTVAFLILCYLAYRAFHKVIEERVLNAQTGINMRF